jgi:SAM-dependent methyltransferase
MNILSRLLSRSAPRSSVPVVAEAEIEAAPEADAPPSPAADPNMIDVKELIRTFDIAEHARRADEYFRDFDLSDARLHKPFFGMETLESVPRLGVLLESLDLFANARVLDFGAGSGWLSQWLALIGCRSTAVDVSKRILDLGKAYTAARFPEAAERVDYLVFDGHRIDLPTGSVDRVICFDSFHHVPNQEEVLSEFYRVLTPEGRAAFSEPGPRHSTSAGSQWEMRTYGVIENDVKIEEIWERARNIGFQRIELSLYMRHPIRCSLEQFESLNSFDSARDLVRDVYDRGLKPVYDDVRIFSLFKGEETLDSRRSEGLTCRIEAKLEDLGDAYRITGTATNTGASIWRPSGSEAGDVNVGIILRHADGTWNNDFTRIRFLDTPQPPGETRPFAIDLNKREIGDAEIHLDLVAEWVAWFRLHSDTMIRVR